MKGYPRLFSFPFNAVPISSGMKGPHCLRPDLSGRVCGTAAGSHFAREAEGPVEGALSFASFCGSCLENRTLGVKENEEKIKGADRIQISSSPQGRLGFLSKHGKGLY
jgi:hypothetical protein